jgi:hypothetical protein
MGDVGKVYRILVVKSEGKRQLAEPSHIWISKGSVWDGWTGEVELIYSAQNSYQSYEHSN